MTSQQRLPNDNKERNPKSNVWVKAFAYVAPQLGLALLLGPLVTVLGGIYAKYHGLSLATIAAVMLVARIFDALTDPLIGYYSDRWRVRMGSRKPFILIGALLLVPCSYFLFVPPTVVSGAYFTFWYMAFYLTLTIFTIPYLAWANEFTEASKDKTLVFSLLSAVGLSGSALFFLIPLLPFSVSTEITPEVLRATVLIGSVIFLVGLAIALILVPDGREPQLNQLATEDSLKRISILQRIMQVISGFLSNKPFLLYVGAFMCLGIGYGMWAGLFFIYVDTFLRLGEDFSKLSLWGMVCGALAIPIWYRLSLYWGKPQAWLVGMVLLMLVFVLTSVLRPGPSGLYALFALNMLMTFSIASMNVISIPMLCDTIDYGRLNDGEERNALYFSIQALLTKLQLAIGGALGLAIVGWFGFDVNATEQTPLSITGLRLSISWLPAFFVILAMFFIAKMPLTEKRMEIIRQRLKTRDERAVGLVT